MWCLLILVSIAATFECTFIEFKNGTSLSRAVSDIIWNFYSQKTPTVNFVHSSGTTQTYKVQDILNEIIDQPYNEVAFQIEEANNLARSYRKKSHNVIICDTFYSCEKIFTKIRPEIFEFEGYFLIVITKYNEHIYETMLKIFGSFWSQHIVNVNILWSPPENDGDTLMYTFWPYTSFYCGEAFPVQLNQYRVENWLKRTDYFPNKVANMYGCPVQVATFHNAPFTIIKEHDGKVTVKGIDGILLRVLSQRMNFKPEIKLVSDLWGEVDVHGNATGEKNS